MKRAAFSLVELLVVVAIIGILISILIPVVSSVRKAAREADVRQQIATLAGAIERYRLDFAAYPGPMRHDEVNRNAGQLPAPPARTTFQNITPPTSGFDPADVDLVQTTGAENLVLALLGGLRRAASDIEYDPALVGTGARGLSPGNPKTYPPYLDGKDLSWRETPSGKTGDFLDARGDAADSVVPEFVDRFNHPLPILYLRSRAGVANVSTPTVSHNTVITDDTNDATYGFRFGSYDISQIIGYTGANIGPDRVHPAHGLAIVPPLNASGFSDTDPMPAYSYLLHPTLDYTPRQKDSFILISAGSDRTYGTVDDICNFGAAAR